MVVSHCEIALTWFSIFTGWDSVKHAYFIRPIRIFGIYLIHNKVNCERAVSTAIKTMVGGHFVHFLRRYFHSTAQASLCL